MTLRVILQIIPFGDEEKAREIGRLDIFNKGPAVINGIKTPAHEYGVIDLGPEPGLYRKTISHYRIDGAWALVYKTLREIYPSEK